MITVSDDEIRGNIRDLERLTRQPGHRPEDVQRWKDLIAGLRRVLRESLEQEAS